MLGIDVGTSSAKIVEATRQGGEFILTNYGELINEGSVRAIHSASIKILDVQVAEIIRHILSEARITTREAVMGIPLFSSFSTLIDLPVMSEEELEKAVTYEARKYIPVPLGEVTFDWMPLEILSSPQKIKVLAVAVPTEVINKYHTIADLTGLRLRDIELETFSAARALVGEKNDPVIILDIGARTTNISITEKGMVIMHHNTDISGLEFTRVLAQGVGVDFQRAEELKKKNGLEEDKEIAGLLSPLLQSLFSEVLRVMQEYVRQGGSRPASLVLSGGSAYLKGLVAYTQKSLDVKTYLGDSFRALSYPPLLAETLREIGPSFTVATGLALRRNNH